MKERANREEVAGFKAAQTERKRVQGGKQSLKVAVAVAAAAAAVQEFKRLRSKASKPTYLLLQTASISSDTATTLSIEGLFEGSA